MFQENRVYNSNYFLRELWNLMMTPHIPPRQPPLCAAKPRFLLLLVHLMGLCIVHLPTTAERSSSWDTLHRFHCPEHFFIKLSSVTLSAPPLGHLHRDPDWFRDVRVQILQTLLLAHLPWASLVMPVCSVLVKITVWPAESSPCPTQELSFIVLNCHQRLYKRELSHSNV